MNVMRSLALLTLLLAGNLHAGEDGTPYQRHPETGLESWTATRSGVTLALTQLTPDQNRAFFMGRDFAAADAEHYAAACGFMTILRNESAAAAVTYDLAAWRAVLPGGKGHPMKLKEDWLSEWTARGLPETQKIAFEWSQLPSTQRFEPGDWNQGMTTFALPRGSRFDLHYRWTTDGRQHRNTLKGVRCANDIGSN
ncbi:MAG: hypothetical protein KGZ83_11600 [Sulfuricella sp.]|nr:hypothetical protein [Sulfuricella sp.]